ncbi:hypothetical protein C7C46_32650 [Streptomyces tateyamensis]|uniref:Uncharacterized protein n=1 Tax=Streptomyces tateyamensis TaxID=565073 RepID=A0A2V4MZC4_9ACTN|nr:hypothetical protein C7C46_32650 [Streptomyces tateyamensis]
MSGTLSAADEAKLNASSAQSSLSPTAGSRTNATAAPTRKGAVANPADYWSETAFEKNSYVDPLDITIVSLAPNISWTANGSTITSYSNAYAVPYAFQYDGWSSSGVSFSWNGCVNCENLQLNSSDTWRNTDFEAVIVATMGAAGYAACGFNSDPAVFQLSPFIRAGNNGSFAWGYNSPSGAAGGCSNLVHFRENHGFGNGS